MERETKGQEIPQWFDGHTPYTSQTYTHPQTHHTLTHRHTTHTHTHTLLKAFLNMSLRSVSFSDEAFSGKKHNFQSCDYYPPVPDY